MIISKDIQPERAIYYLGARVLEIIKNSSREEVDFFDTYQELNEIEKVSIKLYVYTLDWLFLLGVITGNKGNIKKCF